MSSRAVCRGLVTRWRCGAPARAGLLVLAVLFLWLASWRPTALAAPITPTESAPGLVHYEHAAFRQAFAPRSLLPASLDADDADAWAQNVRPPPPDDPGWVDVPLPTSTPKDLKLPDGLSDTLIATWYCVTYVMPKGLDPAEGAAIYVPRIAGAAVRVLQWTPAGDVPEGGRWQVIWNGQARWRNQWNRPVEVELAARPDLVAGTPVHLVVEALQSSLGEHSMSTITVGPALQVASRAQWRRFLQLDLPKVSSVSFLLIGVASLMYWWKRQSDRAQLLLVLSSFAWALRNLHYYLDSPLDPTAFAWFWWMSNMSLSWMMVLTYIYALRYEDTGMPAVERAMAVFVIALSVVTMPLWPLPVATLVVQHMINAAVALIVLGIMTAKAVRGASVEFRVITGALWAGELLGMHDLLLLARRITPESVYLLPLATLLLMMAYLFAVQRRYRLAIEETERSHEHLAWRLREREQELERNHIRMRRIEKEQALLLERQRLMRDMHDGLGSTLLSSLVMVEQGKLGPKDVAELLRECVDDLRLVIDSLEPVGQDLVALLASLRHRLGTRMEAAGLKMNWEVDDLPPLVWLQPPDSLQVLRIVQEALTNVLKHAHAKTVTLSTRLEGRMVQVQITDDGAGFDPATVAGGRGLRNLQQRATRLAGRLEIDSRAGAGTTVRLSLPLERTRPV